MTFKRSPEIHAAIIAYKAVLSASEVGTIYGLSRNAVIGIWDRAGTPPLTIVQRHIIEKRTKTAAGKRRRAMT